MSDAREWLNGRPDAAAVYDEVGDVAWAAQRTIAWDLANAKVMREALLAVLDLHAPFSADIVTVDGDEQWCTECVRDWDGEYWDRVAYPCATVRAITKALVVSE